LIATVSLFVVTIAQSSLAQYFIQARAELGWSAQRLGGVLSAVAFTGSLFRAIGTGLLLAAVFVGRRSTGDGIGSVTDATAPESQPRLHIGGWLVLPAIGFVVGPIIGAVTLIVGVTLFSDVAAAGFGGLYALELAVQLGVLAFITYAATRFFGKKTDAPSTVIALLTVTLVASFLLLVIELAAGAEAFAIASGKQLIGNIISAAIWIPYFRVSTRVKATFVR
jgi:hypothetical protein